MKQVPQELLDHLHTAKEFIKCDLYKITLKSGLVFRYADFDRSITWDAQVWSHKGPTFKRGRIKLSSKIEVDKLTVNVYSDQSDIVGGSPLMHVAHNGGFDEAKLSLYKCFLKVPTTDHNMMMTFVEQDAGAFEKQFLEVVGAVEMFSGYITIDNGGGLGMKWVVKSDIQKLDVEYPPRKYYPTCPFTTYDGDCGLNIVTFTRTGTVTAVNSMQDINTNLAGFADDYFSYGGIEWLSGNLAGASAPVETSYNASGRVVMLIPLGASPQVGDTFKIYPGCPKTPEACKDKFNNINKNRATPYIPLKETLL